MSKTLIVIGGGPGGYAAAIKAAQLGAQVILAESASLGGTCLNAGCVPTKSLLHTAVCYRRALTDAVPGIKTSGVELDWPGAQSSKATVVKRLAGGVEALLRQNGVAVRNEKAVPLSGHSVKIGNETYAADAVILAVGSVNTPLVFPGAGLPCVFDSSRALSLERVPESMVIVGGGVIGLEFAALFSMLGSKITIIELTPNLLPLMDADISEYMQASLESDGVCIHTTARLTDVKNSPDGCLVSFNKAGETLTVPAETVLVAAGRQPNTVGQNLESIGVKITDGAVDTDECFRTNIDGLYAVGDCNGKAMLAHAATAQGETAAEHIMISGSHINNKIIPACVYTSPEIASAGLTEKQVQASGIEYGIGYFNLSGNAKAVIEGSHGFVKIIADKKYGEILGVHIVGPNATELIAGAALCMSMEGTIEDIVNTIHAHPTVSESLREAASALRNAEHKMRVAAAEIRR